MKKTLLIIIILAAQFAHASTMLISDIDDTIKKSHVLSIAGAVARATQDNIAFLGMAQLYRLIESEKKNLNINYVTNAPELIMTPFHWSFLSENDFPQSENLYLRAGFDHYHKLRTIYSLLDEKHPENVILIGDNGENDPEIFATVVKNYPHIKFKTFIRIVYSLQGGGKSLQPGQTPFVTSGDLALRLHSMNELSLQASNEIIEANLQRTIFDYFRTDGVTLRLPRFVECYDFIVPSAWRKNNSTIVQQLVAAIDDRCSY